MRIGYLMQEGVPDVRAPRPSGAANHVRQVIRELRRLGHQVRLLARLDDRVWVSDDLESYRLVGVPGTDRGVRRLAERGLRRFQSQLRLPYLSFFDSRRFAAACVQELGGADLLYERMGWMGLGGALAADRLGIPHLVEVNGDHVAELQILGFEVGGIQLRLSMALMRRVLRGATFTVATGEGWRARHVARWHVDPTTTSVIQNGTEIVDLLERRQLRAFQEELQAGGSLRVAFVGSFEPWQGLPLLLTGAARALESGANLTLVLAGSGRQERVLREMARGLGLAGRVAFVGHLSPQELAACLSQCDVGVSLYQQRVEYTGLKLLDYKAAGLATIAAGQGGQPALIEHGRTGLIIPPNDPGATCEALRLLAANIGLAREMGRLARHEAECGHRWAHTARALDSLFVRLVAERRLGYLAIRASASTGSLESHTSNAHRPV